MRWSFVFTTRAWENEAVLRGGDFECKRWMGSVSRGGMMRRSRYSLVKIVEGAVIFPLDTDLLGLPRSVMVTVTEKLEELGLPGRTEANWVAGSGIYVSL